jgi:hypothetical protein
VVFQLHGMVVCPVIFVFYFCPIGKFIVVYSQVSVAC